MVERLEFEGGMLTIEYELAPNMVLFSHDFASLRDDHGLLSDIAGHLPEDYGYVLFDYYDTNNTGQSIQVKSFTEQLRRLSVVLQWLHRHDQVRQVDIVAHAFGCIVVAKQRPVNVRTIIMLAPPTTMGGERIGWFKELTQGSQTAGIWKVQRPDGVTISVPNSFINEVKQIDSEAELSKLALQRSYLMVLPSHDEVLNDADYTGLIVMPNVHAKAIEDTDHYFEGAGRQGLIAVVQQSLQHPELIGTD